MKAHVSLVCMFLTALAILPWLDTASADESDHRLPAWQLGFQVETSTGSPMTKNWGGSPNRRQTVLAVRASTTVLQIGPASLAYAAEFVPLHFVGYNAQYGDLADGHQTVYGIGIVPLGLEMDLAVRRRYQLCGAIGVGCVRFDHEVPIKRAGEFSFTFEAGGGARWEYRQHHWLEFGATFRHLSNNGTQPKNPGLNATMLYLGWQTRLGHQSSTARLAKQ